MDPRSARGPVSPVSTALPAEYFTPGMSSFADFVGVAAPHLLPGSVPAAAVAGDPALAELGVRHGTTIVALTFSGGVLIAGDRRATAGNMIAQRDIEKVFVADNYSAVGIAGTAGIAVELVRLFTVELAHYEKIEGVPLSLDGKVNKLAGMVRGNLGAALQGLAAIPLFIGFDEDAADPAQTGRIVSFDVVGSKSDETGYHSVGSGSVFARSALKKRHDPAADSPTAIRTALEALYDAADDDTATGLPDLSRGIYPAVITITAADGAVRHPDEEIGEVARGVVEGRLTRPGG
ncbi:MAG TPA: proteasome subunit beta [Pseudonocardia sp.]|uniref:proteasome subunit beta n=1 Tax=Pseudonocardia sp. TaxID=60912 RepID=UPI002C9984B3|nr:proteasome subunit beta [Pseudonocardia sp.]HTF48407.1 proteasome subunit beta [Pseudonocardia sp.]